MQRGDPRCGELDELVVGAELDRVGRARLRARGLEAVLQAVVAEGALGGPAVVVVAVDDAERARRDAVAAAVADVGLQDHRLELGADQRAGRAGVQAARVRAVLADVGHEHPAPPVRRRDGARRCRAAVSSLEQLDEAHVAPRRRAERRPCGRSEARRGSRRRRRAGRSTACTRPRTPCSRCTSSCR